MAIAYFTTWTTYGTWLPGDDRWWYDSHGKLRPPDLWKQIDSALRMNDDAVRLTTKERRIVEATIAEHCRLRSWTLHAVNCRTNHVHAVVTAQEVDPKRPRKQFKAWCSRKLNELTPRREWWTERGWEVYLDDEIALYNAIRYVRDGQ